MAFRDHLGQARIIAKPTSCIHGLFDTSVSEKNCILLFENLIEAKGHRAALNLLTRDRLAKTLNVPAADLVERHDEGRALPLQHGDTLKRLRL